MAERKYGWKPSPPDFRDYKFKPPMFGALPDIVDLRSKCPIVYDQNDLGSCGPNAAIGNWEFEYMKQTGGKPLMLSRLFLYYNVRVDEKSVNTDSGTTNRGCMKSLATLGSPPEAEWPYKIQQYKVKPSATAYKDAKQNISLNYLSVNQKLTDMQTVLYGGHIITIGFSVYESFEAPSVAKTGVVPMPGKKEDMLGGHAVDVVGYNNSTKHFIMRNSWGKSWGLQGYFLMPYDYLLSPDLASDFWTILLVK